MLFSIISGLVLHILLPAYFIDRLLRSRPRDKFSWLLQAVTGGTLVAFLALAGRWDWFSIYLRYVPAILFIPAVLVSARRLRDLPIFVGRQGKQWLGTGMAAFEALLAVASLALAVRGQFLAGQPVQLSFPLRDGDYYVGQGGNSTEPHLHVHAVQGRPDGPLQGNGLPIVFDGQFPVGNTIFHRQDGDPSM